MQTSNIPANAALQSLVDRLINNLLPIAVRNNSSIVNDIPARLNIGNDENTVTSVISGLLRSVINNARESCIHVSAKEMYGKMMMLSVKDSNSFNTYAIACSLQDMVPLVKKIGGQLDISNQQKKITTVAFQFPIE